MHCNYLLKSLLKSSKTKLVFKDVDDIEKVFSNLGLDEIAEDQPTLNELLE